MNGNVVNCIECDSGNDIGEGGEIGQVISCSCCGTLLEIMSIAPLAVQKAPQILEDFGE